MITITIVFYLIGCVLAYISLKRITLKKMTTPWTVADRRAALFFSLTSWLAVLVCWFLSPSGDREARW